ncbi:MFS transporter [Brachybacterium phenoliresistens]|uniref:MFS transporter n=1 Tax=Brachybacterium phenoliresistens TaxID=396014 RepID=Z9JWJ4_9MICO|nr:MFS transporter [Brachybacterium phenoliresistens]EWS82524.1 MFS transporter [Brachybacterium phenoliresistens]
MTIAPPAHPKTALAVSTCAFFLTTLDILIVNIALAAMGDDLGGGTSALQWVVDGYTVAFAALLLSAGSLADRIGARRAMGAGIILFGVTSVLCALAPSAMFLIAARAGQGAAAALILPASMALIREAYPDSGERAHALGIWTAGGAVSAAAGPLFGGFLTMVDWRLVFAINIPVCLAMLAMMPRIAPSPRHEGRFDIAGQLLAVIALVALVYGLIEGGATRFADPVAVGALVVAVLGLAAFVLVQARGAHPMMPLSLFRPRDVRIALLGGFANIGAWFGTVFLTSLFLQQELGLSPVVAGLAFLPAALVALFGNLGSGPLITRFGPRVPVVSGLACATIAMLLMAATLPLHSPWLIAGIVVIAAIGGAIGMPPLTGLVLSSVEHGQAGIASAVLNTFRQIGGALAIAVFGVLASTAVTFETGARISFLIAAVPTALAALYALRIPGPLPRTGASGAERAETAVRD